MSNITPETIVNVTNRSNGVIIYRIPERHIRREFNRKETKRIPYQELLEVAAQPGGRALIYNFLLVENPEALRESLNVKEEPEYWLTEEKIPTWMNTCTLAEFQDALDYAPVGVLDLIKQYAVSGPLNDVAKREALLTQLKFNVDAAIKNVEADAAADNSAEATKTSSAPKRRAPQTPTYKVVQKEETSNK